MIRLQKCPELSKEGKEVMLPKPCNENEKDRPENLRLITLTEIFYRIIFDKPMIIFKCCIKRKELKLRE
jgi:hypothetical protein